MTVAEYLQADRQWPHHLRVAHAQMQLDKATSSEDYRFWQLVLSANQKGASSAPKSPTS
jgi:hypothetical protein